MAGLIVPYISLGECDQLVVGTPVPILSLSQTMRASQIVLINLARAFHFQGELFKLGVHWPRSNLRIGDRRRLLALEVPRVGIWALTSV